MHKGRLEAFSDGVFAIIITIMVLELKVPHDSDPAGLLAILPVFLSYIISFIYVGIYWNNHHHMFQAVKQVRGATLWANLHLLFWLSLTPFVTAWAGENHFAPWPTALYGFDLLMCGTAYAILVQVLVKDHGADSLLGRAIGNDRKGKLSMLLYLIAIGLSFCFPIFACLIYVSVAFIWLVPDTRIETRLNENEKP